MTLKIVMLALLWAISWGAVYGIVMYALILLLNWNAAATGVCFAALCFAGIVAARAKYLQQKELR